MSHYADPHAVRARTHRAENIPPYNCRICGLPSPCPNAGQQEPRGPRWRWAMLAGAVTALVAVGACCGCWFAGWWGL